MANQIPVRKAYASLLLAAELHEKAALRFAASAQSDAIAGNTTNARLSRECVRGLRVKALHLSAEAAALAERHPHLLGPEH